MGGYNPEAHEFAIPKFRGRCDDDNKRLGMMRPITIRR